MKDFDIPKFITDPVVCVFATGIAMAFMRGYHTFYRYTGTEIIIKY